MTKSHSYEVQVTWTGNTGAGTAGYRHYARDHDVSGVNTPGKPMIPGTADPAFRGHLREHIVVMSAHSALRNRLYRYPAWD